MSQHYYFSKLNIEKKYLMQVLAGFILLDLLFFPYFKLVILPYSLPLVFAFIFFDKNYKLPAKHILYFGVIAFLVMLSVYLSLFLSSSGDVFENLKRAVQFLTSFWYFSFFYYVTSNFNSGVISKKIISIFLLYFFLLSVFFYIDPLVVNSLLRVVYGDTVTSEEVVNVHFRYAYIFSDPNTAAYFLLIACVPLFYATKNLILLTAIFLIITASLLMTQSRGALLVFFVCTLVGLASTIFRRRHNKEVIITLLAAFLFLSLLIFYYFFLSESSFSGSYFDNFTNFERLSTYEGYSGGSRLEIWKSLVVSLEPLPVGRGYSLIVDNELVKPHSDALRLIYGYGFVVFILFFVFFVILLLRYPLFTIPALAAFLINTLIDEQKLLALFFCWAGTLYGIRDNSSKDDRLNIGSKFFK